MRFQELSYSCGAGAIVNALRCFGKRVPERTIRSRAGTTEKDGTQEEGMAEALRSYGVHVEPFELDDKSEAMEKVSENISRGYPVIICIQNFQHWVTIIGMVGDRFIVVDPAKTKMNLKENGIHVVTKRTLSKMWKSKDGIFYGMKIST